MQIRMKRSHSYFWGIANSYRELALCNDMLIHAGLPPSVDAFTLCITKKEQKEWRKVTLTKRVSWNHDVDPHGCTTSFGSQADMIEKILYRIGIRNIQLDSSVPIWIKFTNITYKQPEQQ